MHPGGTGDNPCPSTAHYAVSKSLELRSVQVVEAQGGVTSTK